MKFFLLWKVSNTQEEMEGFIQEIQDTGKIRKLSKTREDGDSKVKKEKKWIQSVYGPLHKRRP